MTLLCLVCTWLLILMLPWCLWVSLRDGIHRLKRMHSIPCSGCAFFTGDYRLKCAVHPMTALTEDAIHCTDYEPAALPLPTQCVVRSCACKGTIHTGNMRSSPGYPTPT